MSGIRSRDLVAWREVLALRRKFDSIAHSNHFMHPKTRSRLYEVVATLPLHTAFPRRIPAVPAQAPRLQGDSTSLRPVMLGIYVHLRRN